MRVFKCEFLGLVDYDGTEFHGYHVPGRVRAKVRMHEDHDRFGALSGGITVTSAVKMIDFERQMIVTQNNIYDYSVRRAVDLVLIETMADFDRVFSQLMGR